VELHTHITAAYHVFENWPRNFHQFLDQKSKGDVRFNPRDGKLDTALKEEFGAFFKRLYHDLQEPQFDFLREAFAQYLSHRLRADCEDTDTFSSVPLSDDDTYISFIEARRLLKISHYSILDLVKAGEIAFAIRSQEKALHYLLRLADVQTVAIKNNQAVGSRELAKQLGVDHSVINRLEEEGHLRRRARRNVDGYHATKFDVDAARRLLRTYNITSTT
jgi:hypothetical protein